MSSVRYQWGGGKPHDRPLPVTATEAFLLVGERDVWNGDVTDELREWARWCAFQVIDLWRCPMAVELWLESGGPSLLETAREQAWGPTSKFPDGPNGSPVWNAECDAIVSARTAILMHGSKHAKNCNLGRTADQVASSARNAFAGVKHTDEHWAQMRYLRDLILRRALPEPRWPLVHEDERVLCDALLDG